MALKPIWCGCIDCSPRGSTELSGCQVNADLICISVSENQVGSSPPKSPDACLVWLLSVYWGYYGGQRKWQLRQTKTYLYCTHCFTVFPSESKQRRNSSQISWNSACLFGWLVGWLCCGKSLSQGPNQWTQHNPLYYYKLYYVNIKFCLCFSFYCLSYHFINLFQCSLPVV